MDKAELNELRKIRFEQKIAEFKDTSRWYDLKNIGVNKVEKALNEFQVLIDVEIELFQSRFDEAIKDKDRDEAVMLQRILMGANMIRTKFEEVFYDFLDKNHKYEFRCAALRNRKPDAVKEIVGMPFKNDDTNYDYANILS